MDYLVDSNLPPAIATWLSSQGAVARHASEIGLERAQDRAIWQHAKTVSACIVTKDEDFVLLRANDPAGPRIVWVRIGNALRRVLIQRFATAWPLIEARGWRRVNPL
jgi:predicted nuclease of predicted toxin-antitoxin system